MKTYMNHSAAWFSELMETHYNGEHRAPRGMPTIERRWAQFAVFDSMTFPVTNVGRDFRDVIGVLEGLSQVGQMVVPELFTERVKKFRQFTDDGVFHGAYGQRVYGHLGDIVGLLTDDPNSRQAVLTIYDSDQDLRVAKADVPCTLNVHFIRTSEELEMRVTMRSNDLWLGMPYDLTQFSILQASIAQALGLVPGLYVHSVGSLHVYARDIERVADLVPSKGSAMPPMAFPLWKAVGMAEISSRARRLMLGTLEPVTPFEAWAFELMHGQ